MELIIKNMVSLRCKMVVRTLLESIGVFDSIIQLGEVTCVQELKPEEIEKLKRLLRAEGFQLLEDKKKILIQRIKNVIIEMIHYTEEPLPVKFSVYLSEKLNYDYTYLSNLFTAVRGTSIEHYIITHKIEKAKELIIYNELTLTQIARKLHYSSVAHLSNQFKKVTGLTPTYFKLLNKKRIGLENM
jgi:AraC-like DNA-binding protein